MPAPLRKPSSLYWSMFHDNSFLKKYFTPITSFKLSPVNSIAFSNSVPTQAKENSTTLWKSLTIETSSRGIFGANARHRSAKRNIVLALLKASSARASAGARAAWTGRKYKSQWTLTRRRRWFLFKRRCWLNVRKRGMSWENVTTNSHSWMRTWLAKPCMGREKVNKRSLGAAMGLSEVIGWETRRTRRRQVVGLMLRWKSKSSKSAEKLNCRGRVCFDHYYTISSIYWHRPFLY